MLGHPFHTHQGTLVIEQSHVHQRPEPRGGQLQNPKPSKAIARHWVNLVLIALYTLCTSHWGLYSADGRMRLGVELLAVRTHTCGAQHIHGGATTCARASLENP